MLRRHVLLSTLAVAGGAAALVYETVALRWLRLELGASTPAVGVVLTVFLAGLALGGGWGGRLAARVSRPLALCGWSQVAAAAGFAAVPLLLPLLRPVHLAVYVAAGDASAATAAVRAAVAGAALLPACLLLGWSLPLLVREADACPAGRHGFGSSGPARTGRLAALNTLGGAAGAVLCAFVLLPAWGSRGALLCGCAIGLVAGLAAVLAGRGAAVRETADASQPTAGAGGGGPLRSAAVAGLLYAAVGALTLGLEVAWTRVLAVWLGASAYAFGLVLAIFVGGLGLGGLLGSRIVRRSTAPAAVAGAATALAGMAGLAAVIYLSPVALAGLSLAHLRPDAFDRLLVLQALMAATLLLPATVLLGMPFPLLLATVSRDATGWEPGLPVPPRRLGWMLVAGGLGCVAGSLLTSFVTVPRFGVEPTLRLLAVLGGLAGAGLLALDLPALRPRSAAARAGVVAVPALLAALLAVNLPAPRTPLLAQGLFPRWVRTGVVSADDPGRILLHRDGWAAAVTVREMKEGERVIFLDGKPDATSEGDLPNQALSAHIPMLLHPKARRVAVVGLASGITAGSAALHAVERIDCAEIEPAMVPACRLFSAWNHAVLDNPKMRLIEVDGRLHLAASPGAYDVIVSEPSNPWVAGMADLFTREFLGTCRRALAPGGMLCMWVEGYSLNCADVRRVLATIRASFDHVQVWSVQPCDYLAIASVDPIKVPADRLLQRFERPDVFRDLARMGIQALPDLLANYVMDTAAVDAFADSAVPLADGGRSLEHSAPRALVDPENSTRVLAAMTAARSANLDWLLPGQLEVEEFLALADRSASNVAARAAATEARFLAWRQGRDAGMARARHAAQINPRDAFLVRLVESIDREARRCLARRDERAASLRYAEWLSIFPDSPEAHYGAGQADRRLGRKDTAYWHLVRATATEPQRLEYRLALAEAAWEAGEQKESIRQYRLGLAQQPDHAAALNNLAVILSRIEPPLRDLKEAVILSERACALTRWKDVRFTRTLVGLYLQSGRAVDAVKLQRQLERAGSGDK